MFFNKKMSRSNSDVSWRDAYRKDFRLNKAYGVGAGPSYASTPSSTTTNPYAPKSRISLYTQSLGIGRSFVSSPSPNEAQDNASHSAEQASKSKEDVSPSKEDVSPSKEDVSRSKEDVSRSKEDVSTSKEDVSTSKEDVSTSKEDVSRSKEDVSRSKKDVSGSTEHASRSREDVSGSNGESSGSTSNGELSRSTGEDDKSRETRSSSATTSSENVYTTTPTESANGFSPSETEATTTTCDTNNCVHNYNCQRSSSRENAAADDPASTVTSGDNGAQGDSRSPEQRETTNEQRETRDEEQRTKRPESRENMDIDAIKLNEGNIPTFTRIHRSATGGDAAGSTTTEYHQKQNTTLNNDNDNSEPIKYAKSEFSTQRETAMSEPNEGASAESAKAPSPRRFNLRPSNENQESTSAAATESHINHNQNHSQFSTQSPPQSPHSQAPPTDQPSFSSANNSSPSVSQQQQQKSSPFSGPPLNTASFPPPQSPEAPGSPSPSEEWTDIEPTARHPPFPNPPTGDISPTGKRDDRPYPSPGSYIPAHFCNVLYAITDRDLKFIQKGEIVGIPLKTPHQVSPKSFENHRKFVYAVIIDIINLKEYRSDASNLLRLNVGPNRKTRTSELKDVYQITSEDPETRAAEAEKKEQEKKEQEKKEQEKKEQFTSSFSSSSEKENKMRSDNKTQDGGAQEEETSCYTPTESSYSGTNSTSGTGSNSRAEWEDSNQSPENERMARKDLEENARKKLEDERLRRKEAKEAEWRAKYGFDKEDPLLKKKQQREEKKRNFWERCSGQETVPEEPLVEEQPDTNDIKDIENIEEVKERISETLDDAWELPEAERKKAVKKLLLKWHPDKNIERGEEAKVLFQHLQKEMKRCEGGIPRIKLTKWRNFMFGKGRPAPNKAGPFKGPTAEEPAAPKSPFTTKKEFTRSTSFTPGSRNFDAQQNKQKYTAFDGDGNGRRFSGQSFDTSSVPEEEPPTESFNRFNRSQSSHESRDSFFKNYMDKMRETRSRARGSSPARDAEAPGGSPDRGRESQHPWRSSPQASPRMPRKPTGVSMECRRWFDQAQRDLRSAKHDFDETSDPSFEWVCFKCHHAAEKALKAVLLAQNLPSTESHDLASIAAVAQNAQLTRLANQMSSLLGDPDRIVYPSVTHAPKIPADAFTQGVATMALSVAKSIINCCDLIVMRSR